MNTRRIVLTLSASALLLIACAGNPKLRPAPGIATLPGDNKTAVAEQSGVRAAVTGDDWKGQPANLESVMTPMRVTLENHSGRPLRVRYNDFALSDADGMQATALPPYRIQGSVAQAVPVAAIRPRFAYNRFFVAPYYAPYFGGFRAWGRPWAFDGGYYRQAYAYWSTPLPTEDMLEQAIPEGVIESGGSVSGYLYFQRIRRNLQVITFSALLIDATDEQNFGRLSIPFVMK